MAIRKRTWSSASGKRGEAWLAEYTDGAGKRRKKQFQTKKSAEVFLAKARVDVRSGTHTPDSISPTVAASAAQWLRTSEAQGLEESTLMQYNQHVRLHIVPLIGDLKLSKLTTPATCDYRDLLLNGSIEQGIKKRSPALTRKILTSLGSIISHAKQRGSFSGSNPVHDLSRGKRGRIENKKLLEVGRDIPLPNEVKRIINSIPAGQMPIIAVAVFCGLRASELRGLRWKDVDLKKCELHVRQRADRFNKIGPPKSKAGRRSLPLSPKVIHSLKEWKLACPIGDADLVFPTSNGGVQHHKNIVREILNPVLITAGLITITNQPKYGLHSLRHFFASWLINRKADGGREMPLKSVQAMMGHSSISITADTYGHLFPRGDDANELAAAEARLLI